MGSEPRPDWDAPGTSMTGSAWGRAEGASWVVGRAGWVLASAETLPTHSPYTWWSQGGELSPCFLSGREAKGRGKEKLDHKLASNKPFPVKHKRVCSWGSGGVTSGQAER